MWSTNDYSLVERCAGLPFLLHLQRQSTTCLWLGTWGIHQGDGHVTRGGFFFGPTGFMLWPPGSQDWKTQGWADVKEGNHGARRMGYHAALATALVALAQLPPKIQPKPRMDDLKKLLIAGCQPGIYFNLYVPV
jgi:hypothetical protein